MTLATIFLIVALICFILAAFNVPAGPISMIGLGLAFVVAAQLVGRIVIG